MDNKIKVMLSNHHVHLKPEDVETLFGTGHEIKIRKMLSPVEFAAEETVTLIGPRGKIEGVRVLGPLRHYTQAELLKADAIRIGVNAPLKNSGELEEAASIRILGPVGELNIKGAIIAKRHIHLKPDSAEDLGIKDRQYVSVKAAGERGLIFQQVLVRVSCNSVDVMHIDLEEGNAANIENNDMLEIFIEDQNL